MVETAQPRWRQATASDAPAITALVRAAYARWVPLIGREPMPMRVDYAEALTRHRIDLLVVDDGLVGLIETLQHPDHLWIENIAVEPQCQGRGHGRMLLAHAEQRAREAGCGELRLLTNAAFASNVALYERTGFHVGRSEPFMGGTTLYLSKRLVEA
ncbi:GNAT family N-acetyltransferase [Devosia aquimaris]|uniref:GNAT family N-acetyltransferase n=1 Tax=Devosia aquimaris TaxID=2866214 RepID=UPI001CD0E616|nr:GNAT family N-acetyltransferase [Devosia sp. CJK-A8-3]